MEDPDTARLARGFCIRRVTDLIPVYERKSFVMIEIIFGRFPDVFVSREEESWIKFMT